MSNKRQRGFGSLRLRGNIWWIRYHVHGRRIEESSGSTRRADALKLLRKRQAEIGSGRLIGPDAERTTFEDLAEMLLADYRVNERRSLDRAQRALAQLRGFFGLSRVIEITRDRLDAYVNYRREQGASRGTIRIELAALKRAMRLAERAGKLEVVPSFPVLRPSDPRTGFFEPEDFEAVLAQLPDYLRPVAEFGYLTGWRKSEILGLTWENVDFKVGIVHLPTSKNYEARTFPFGPLPRLKAVLERQRRYTDQIQREQQRLVQWVFHHNGEPIRDFYTAWRSACQKAAIERRNGVELVTRPQILGRTFHDLRRTVVRNLVRAGVPERVAMTLTGHKTRSVFDRYHIVSERDLTEGVERFARVWGQFGDNLGTMELNGNVDKLRKSL